MKKLIRQIFPQWVINYFWHLPKAILANIYYGFPSRGLKVVGITGTDGKTTTTNMVFKILKDAGKKVAMVSTTNAVVGGKSYDTGFHVTSPDPLMIQRFAKQASDNGDECLVLEVTSHAIDQFRFWGIKFLVGVITNITHEHLDYHKTFKNYLNTKLKLLKTVQYAVINNNLKQTIQRSRLITFGKKLGEFNQRQINLNLKIPGDYNIENALAALAVTSVLGVNQGLARKSLESFENLTGRMEEVPNKKRLNIFIDFAHTPNGLENALKTLRSHIGSGKLIALIGCEGYRDVAKRELMGKISGKLTNITIVTSVDPRGQSEIINEQIIEGLLKSGAKKDHDFFVIDDRQKAINFAINDLAKKGDTIGIFGKGHEVSMNLDGREELPWSDREAVEKALNG